MKNKKKEIQGAKVNSESDILGPRCHTNHMEDLILFFRLFIINLKLMIVHTQNS